MFQPTNKINALIELQNFSCKNQWNKKNKNLNNSMSIATCKYFTDDKIEVKITQTK